MLRTIVVAYATATALAAPVWVESMPTVPSVDDFASFDPMAAYDEGRLLAEELDGRQLAETTAAATAKAKKPAGASGPGQMGVSGLRYKLSQSYCPTADSVEKGLLACKNQALGAKVRASKDESAKKQLTEERKALYAEASKMNDADKKKAGADHKKLYVKAYAKYCAGPPSAHADVCQNDLMKKMYAGTSSKIMGAKKAAKKA